MTIIFIGGSLIFKKLNTDIENRLNNIIKQSFDIIIGDAFGIDLLIQQYLNDNQYKNVTVHYSGKCRNNIGNWNTCVVKGGIGKEYYSAKDIVMATKANYGLMIWDGKSKGTYNNIINLINKNKKVLLCVNGNFHTIANYSDLIELNFN